MKSCTIIDHDRLAFTPTGGDAGANQIKRENSRRRLVVRCNARDRDLGGVVADIKAAVAKEVPMPEGYHVEYGGQFESQEQATRLIAVLGAVCAVGMFCVLLLLFPARGAMLMLLVSLAVGGATAAGGCCGNGAPAGARPQSEAARANAAGVPGTDAQYRPASRQTATTAISC